MGYLTKIEIATMVVQAVLYLCGAALIHRRAYARGFAAGHPKDAPPDLAIRDVKWTADGIPVYVLRCNICDHDFNSRGLARGRPGDGEHSMCPKCGAIGFVLAMQAQMRKNLRAGEMPPEPIKIEGLPK